MLPGDAALIVGIPLVMAVVGASGFEVGKWWEKGWTVRKGYGVDALAMVAQVLVIAGAVMKDWLEDEGGAARGEWRPNKKYYRQFGRTLALVSNTQEMLFGMIENNVVRKRWSDAAECTRWQQEGG